jgi:hypothetical protein
MRVLENEAFRKWFLIQVYTIALLFTAISAESEAIALLFSEVRVLSSKFRG